jgi:hypothetical protein
MFFFTLTTPSSKITQARHVLTPIDKTLTLFFIITIVICYLITAVITSILWPRLPSGTSSV